MKITKRQLRNVIREAMNPDHVDDAMNMELQHFDPDSRKYLDKAMQAIEEENYRTAAMAVYEALWITAQQNTAAWEMELEQMLMTVETEDELAGAVADWVNRHFEVNDFGRIMGKIDKGNLR